MIELRITNSAALLLLNERMKIEFDYRKKRALYPEWIRLKDLNYSELLEIAETASFDLICLLPADILIERNNLDEIIAKAVRSLAAVYNRDEFNVFSLKRARNIIKRIQRVLQKIKNDNSFLYN